jgi:membrane carboxypeptidase/penicillin-binding protein
MSNEQENLSAAALEYHEWPTPGKIAVVPTKGLTNQRDLALAYSPGVAAACNAIVDDPNMASRLTSRANLVGVVTNGTGGNAAIPGISVAGKTGTAETGPVAPPHVWFLAFAPADNPRVAVAVIVENGGRLGNAATGGAVAAPIARSVMEAVLGS